ncbi:MAG: YceD family protein [Acidimicrobiia bacterium]
MSGLRFQVTDLIGHPGLSRSVAGEFKLHVQIGETTVDDLAEVSARLDSVSEGILVNGAASTVAHYRCARCLIDWDGPVQAEFMELFARAARSALVESDQYLVSHDGFVDLEPLVHDELSLALPPDPLCRPDCRGLCPTCGADLNVSPCAGHGDQPRSPFAALEQLFGSES